MCVCVLCSVVNELCGCDFVFENLHLGTRLAVILSLQFVYSVM